MSRTGVANLPLHPGKAPRWLFKRMVLLSKGILEVLLYEYGIDEFLRRLSDPFWFQSLACVLGWDWHSSGASTVTCGALKEAIDPLEYGIAVAGGKGKASRKTISEVFKIGELYNLSTSSIDKLQYTSRMTAKVDNTAVQDGHNLYHHVMIFSENGKWAVIQQGMNNDTNYARRYHWLSDNVKNYVCEPHNAIISDVCQDKVLDMTSKYSISTQNISVDLVNDNPNHLKRDWAKLNLHQNQRTLYDLMNQNKKIKPIDYLNMPRSINWAKMNEIYDIQPKNYEDLLAIKGVGPSTIRALALISDLIYGEKPSWKDPIRFTYAHGGKDGVPYPVNRKAMDESTVIIQQGIKQAKIGNKEKIRAIKRLNNFVTYKNQ